jgi:wyosine [tRNA(Phe)-imidazoG37] synthetase (radical SAM superfamily)
VEGEIIYGPVDSRRLGRSLGINFTPAGCRVCDFECVYCDVTESEGNAGHWPSAGDVGSALSGALYQAGPLDSITISGFGEPTLHPRFGSVLSEVVSQARRARPEVPVRILSNGSGVRRPEVQRALALLDERILAFDAAAEIIDRPHCASHLAEIHAAYEKVDDVTLQSCFVDGKVSNVDPQLVALWVEGVAALAPRAVQVYTIDRAPREGGVEPATRTRLEDIAQVVTDATGIPVSVTPA